MSNISPEHRRILAGYRMPPEWAPHLACYLAWPHNRDTWPGKFDVIVPRYAQMAGAIAMAESKVRETPGVKAVRLMVTDENEIEEARELIRDYVQGPEDYKDKLLPHRYISSSD